MSLTIPPCLRSVIRRGPAVAIALALVVPWSAAHAKTPKHCRDIELRGAAGIASQDTVQFKILDSTGTVLDQSCVLQVRYGESDAHFTQRLPQYWGRNGGADCGVLLPSPGPTPAPGPTPRDVDTCSKLQVGDYACKHQYISKAGATVLDPPIHMLRVCCWKPKDPNGCIQGPGGTCCSGKKIHAVDKKICTAPLALETACKDNGICTPCKIDANCDSTTGAGDGRCGRKPITVQTSVQGALYDPPNSLIPFTGTNASQLVVDPIGIIQRAAAATQGCRGALGKAMNAYAAGRANALEHCAREDLTENGCDDVKRDEIFDKLDTDFRAVVDKSCVPQGPPRRLGYAACPSPCDGTVIASCTAGLTGQACAKDTDCDTALNAADGLCGPGDWQAAKDCMVCLADTMVDQSFDTAYGAVTGPLSPEAEKCQVDVGKVLLNLIGEQTKENAKCQKTVDGGKKPLVFCQGGVCTGPPQTTGQSCSTSDDCLPYADQLCKYADVAGKRVGAELDAKNHILGACDPLVFAELDSCGSDPMTETDCIIDAARGVGQSLADAVFPEGIGHTVP